MRTSCNGCRVLRRGCADDCSIRPCLEWIKTPESQAHATIFLAKFYGRAGLINLISTGPHQHRPAIFRSLLYEACGRIVDPIHGATGLMLSGRWKLCQTAVEAVLQGAPVAPNPTAAAGYNLATPIKVYDIRHVIKVPDDDDGPSVHLHKVSKGRGRFKRSAPAAKPLPFFSSPLVDLEENGSGFSVESAEGSHVSQAEANGGADEGEVGLELTLGFNPVGGGACGSKSGAAAPLDAEATAEMATVHPSRLELGLGLSA